LGARRTIKPNAGQSGREKMNNLNPEVTSPDRQITSARNARSMGGDELSRLKRELVQAEVRLGRARATVTVAELDIKAINSRIRELVK
jgi:predicted  nucleic acid-binding Zn-ribbon protein